MEVKDFRVGNIVTNPKGDIFELTTGAFFLFHAYAEWEVLPIELTEDYLLRFGVNTTSTAWDIGFDLKDGKCQVTFNHEPITEIKYVHQLQNLYFALTNTELQLNEKA